MVGAHIHLILTLGTIPLRQSMYQARGDIYSRKAALTPEGVEMTPFFVGCCFKTKGSNTDHRSEHVMTTV